MGLYLNPNADAFKRSLNSKIFIDKSLVLAELNELVDTDQNFVCMSRPRRFGKSLVANLISAYYSKGCDTRSIFSQMKVGQVSGFDKYLNKLNVIKLDMNGLYQNAIQMGRCEFMMADLHKTVTDEFKEQFQQIRFSKSDNSINQSILKVYKETGEKFVIIIDEYDVLVREKVSQPLFDNYLSFLNGLFKDTTLRPAIALAYIIGIMPIVRDKVQSKLNEFIEYTMLRPRQFAGMIGFTSEEVSELCRQYGMDEAECARWYNGYKLNGLQIHNSHSIVCAMLDGKCRNNWSSTGSFEAVSDYIQLNFDGIKDDVVSMLAGGSVELDVTSFTNTLRFRGKDDVFTYLIHLGYLTYDEDAMTCSIPNEEVRQEWVKAVKFDADYSKLFSIISASKQLLDETINGNEEAVARALDAAHTEVTSPLSYNHEQSLQSAICLAYFYANTRYTLFKELPTGKGYADLVLVPYLPNIPALVIELKRNKSTESAIKQLRERGYNQALARHYGNLLFVGVNYDEKTKVHTCKIERVE